MQYALTPTRTHTHLHVHVHVHVHVRVRVRVHVHAPGRGRGRRPGPVLVDAGVDLQHLAELPEVPVQHVEGVELRGGGPSCSRSLWMF